MKLRPLLLFLLALGLTIVALTKAQAQQHRATRLGNPATRFAPPLNSPDDLRDRFRDEKLKPDIASILNQMGWKGNLADIHRAAATAEITEIKIPKGTIMPFMSSRENGKPIALREVLWAGKEPVSAYVFFFSSNGRRYRCVTPRPCSNFYVEDLGSEAPKFELTLTAPAETSLCDPFEIKAVVRNSGGVAIPQIQVADTLPPGIKTLGDQTHLSLETGPLQPGEGREFRIQARAIAAGAYTNQARAVGPGAKVVEATVVTLVRAPAIALECNAPGEVLMGQPVEVCLTVRNSGDAPESKTTVTLPIPEGSIFASATEGGAAADGRISWEVSNLAANASRKLCATVSLRRPGSLSFAAVTRSACSSPAQAAAATEVKGVPAVLVELVDLEDPIVVGDNVTYLIKITNQGYASLTNLRLVCTVPDSQEFVSASGATAAQCVDRQITTESLPVVEPKGQAYWRVVTRALKEGDSRFTAAFTSSQFKEPIFQDEATQLY